MLGLKIISFGGLSQEDVKVQSKAEVGSLTKWDTLSFCGNGESFLREATFCYEDIILIKLFDGHSRYNQVLVLIGHY